MNFFSKLKDVIKMYAVVCYRNCEKNQNIRFMNTFADYKCSIEHAKKYAETKYGVENVINQVDVKHVEMNDIIVEFSQKSSYDKDVFAVVILPQLNQKGEISEPSRRDSEPSRRDSLDSTTSKRSSLFGDVQTYEHTNQDTDQSYLIVISDTESEADTEAESEADTEYDYDYDMDVDDLYDDRYDEREDYDRGYGYEDECYECIDF